MLPSTFSCLRQGPTHVTDTVRCPTPCPNLTEVARLRQLSLCCSRSGTSPSSWACSVLFPALQLSRTAVCAATELLVRCSQDLFDFQTVLCSVPDWRGEPVVTGGQRFGSALLRCELTRDGAREFRSGKGCLGMVLTTRDVCRQVGVG